MQYWKIAPGQGGFAWVEQKDHGCIAIGSSEVGDMRKYKTKEQLAKAFDKAEYNHSPTQLWRFYKDTSKDDKVVASSGRKIYGIGRIIGRYKFEDELIYKHSKPVRWELKYWEPVDITEIGLPESLQKRLRLNRTILKLTKKEWEILDKCAAGAKSPFEGMNSFEGILRAPETEQEVIILFSKLSQHLRMKIESVSTRFPDVYIRVKKGNKWITKAAEFEIHSSDFERHGHRAKDCDMIICWQDDWKRKPEHLEVIELKREMLEIL